MDNLKQNSKEDKNEKVPPIDPKNIPPMTYFILSKQGLNSYNLLGEQKKVEPNNNLSFKNVSHLGISEDGELLVLTFDVSRTLKLIDTKTEKVLHDITVDNNIRKILISPLKKYIMTFAHWKSEQKEGNMILWSVQTGEILKRYEQKSLDKWHIQFTPDDEYMLKMENNKIAAYKMTEIEKVETTIEAKGATDFSISNIIPYNIAIFTPSIGSKPAFIQIFKWLSFKQPVSSISFFRGHDVQFLWNSRGNALLALVTSTLDSSNNNYYGNTDLYYLKTAGFSCPIEAGKLIHNVAWHKYGKRFAVISGSPPTTTTIYNWEKAEEKENFGRAYVNNAKFSNNGYLLALMGFGTFKGNITIWDQKRVKEICSVDAFTSSTFDWSPDSKYFITATLARMQDNSYKLWHYDGTILLEEKFDSITMAFFKAQSFELFPLKQPSPRLYEKAQQQKKVTQKEETSKYVPPQRRGVGTSSISQKLSELRNLSDTPQYVPPSSSGTSKFDKLGSKNEVQLPFGFGFEPELKKKKKKKPVKKNKATTNNNNNNPNDNISENNSNDNNDNNNNKTLDLPNLHKELNKINQKLREIEKLKNSPNLQPNQKSKLASENQLLHQKMNLEKQISSSKN